MRALVIASADLHDTASAAAPATAGGVNVGDHVDVEGELAGQAFVRGTVVEPPPRRSGFIDTRALGALPAPPTAIDALSFYTFLFVRTAGSGADQRYLFALATAESGLSNTNKIANSDAFGPYQFTSARWAELLSLVGANSGLVAADRMTPFAQARLAILEELAASQIVQTALTRPPQRNELYLLHLLPVSAAQAFLDAVKSAPNTSLDEILVGASGAQLINQRSTLFRRSERTATVAEALDLAASALEPGLAKSVELDPPVQISAPLPGADALNRTLPMAKQALATFLAAQWTKAQACGIIANIKAESGFDFTNNTGDRGTAFGLCQWRGDRQKFFATTFRHSIAESTFQEQLDFITIEMTKGALSERTAGIGLARATTPSAAAEVFCRLYERPANPDKDSQIRAGLAEAYALLLS